MKKVQYLEISVSEYLLLESELRFHYKKKTFSLRKAKYYVSQLKPIPLIVVLNFVQGIIVYKECFNIVANGDGFTLNEL